MAEDLDFISLREWERGGEYYSYHENKIFIRSNNTDKTPLLLLHGFPTSSWDYSYLWEGLGAQFNLLAIDMLGFGLSDKPYKHNYSTEEQVNLIEEILKSKGINKVHILAHDYGDTVAQEMIARYEQRSGTKSLEILSVCFLNGGLFPESHVHTVLQGVLASKWGGIVRHLITKKRAYQALRELFGKRRKPSDAELDVLWQLIVYKQGDKISHKLLQYIKERKELRERWVGALQRTKISIRLINGPADPVSGINMVENYQKNIASPDIVLIDGAGHFPHIEAPNDVLKAYIQFHENIKTSN